MEYALKRLLTAAAAVFVMAAVAVPVARAAIPQGAITWTPDHRARTIGVSVKLEIYPACGADVGTCQVESTMADVIRKQILSIWNQGAHYRCYELIFDVNITLGTNRFGVDDDRVGVRIDQSPVAIRSEVMGVSGLSRQPLSDDPSDKFVPTNDVLRPTTWAFPSSQPNLYAHEFGHVIGLHDTYEDQGDSSVPIPGAPHDLMSTMAANISQETYDRVVKRSGVVKDSDLRCGYQFEFSGSGAGPDRFGEQVEVVWHYWGLLCEGSEQWKIWENFRSEGGMGSVRVDTGPPGADQLTGPFLVTFGEDGAVTHGSWPGYAAGDALLQGPGAQPRATIGGTTFTLTPPDEPTEVRAEVPVDITSIPVTAPVEPADGTIGSCEPAKAP